MANYIHVKAPPPDDEQKEAEAAKTARQRAVRLTKEAADREAGGREITTAPPKDRGHRVNHSKARGS
jgi:hypothetical protein